MAEFDRWITDYVGDMLDAGFSLPDVRLACAAWRSSDSKRMPSPGELLAKGRATIGSAKSSKLPVTVPQALHNDMAGACGEPFAGSYLSGATVEDGVLITRTSIARDRLRANREAMDVLDAHRLTVAEICLMRRN